MSASELCAAAGVSQATASAKAGQIMEMLKIYQLDPNWCCRSLLDENPLAWLVSFNGLIVDVRHLPREVQEIAYLKGLIPYVPEEG